MRLRAGQRFDPCYALAIRRNLGLLKIEHAKHRFHGRVVRCFGGGALCGVSLRAQAKIIAATAASSAITRISFQFTVAPIRPWSFVIFGSGAYAARGPVHTLRGGHVEAGGAEYQPPSGRLVMKSIDAYSPLSAWGGEMFRRRIRFVLSFAFAFLSAFPACAQSPTASAEPEVIEHGKFVLHKFEQPIGEESFDTTREAQSLVTKVSFKFVDRGTAVPLTATFRSLEDLTPQAFEIKGKSARPTQIDEAVEIQGDKIRVRNREKWTEDARPKQFFAIAGYAPATMQMLMVRYWASHGSPAVLETFPARPRENRAARPRHRDNRRASGETLDRYTIEGLIWGRETLWFDSKRNLAAAVTIDAEFDHFEAIREGYEDALGKFVGIAGTDGMAALADISKNISGSRAETLAIVGGTLIDGTGSAPVADSVVLIEKGRIGESEDRGHW